MKNWYDVENAVCGGQNSVRNFVMCAEQCWKSPEASAADAENARWLWELFQGVDVTSKMQV